MKDTDKVIFLNRNGTGPGSTPQEPLALVAKMSDLERSDMESEQRGGFESAAEAGITSPEIQYRTSIHHSLTFFSQLLDYWAKCTISSTVSIMERHQK